VVVSPSADPRAPLLVLCHGMGETPEGILPRWSALTALPVHVVAPAGPYPHEIRTPQGIRIGHAWYLYDGGTEMFKQSLDRAVGWLHALLPDLERERGWTPRERAIVGYSQGAYFAYVAALGAHRPFRRLVGAAGRLKEEFLDLDAARAGEVETLILHGRDDDSVSPEAAHRTADALARAGYPHELRLVDGGHRAGAAFDREATAWLAAGWGFPPRG